MKYRKDVYTNLVLVTQLSIHMLTPIFLCLGAGLAVDHFFHTKLVLLFLILGVLAGGRNTYVLAMKAASQGQSRDHEDEELERKILEAQKVQEENSKSRKEGN